MVEAPDRRGEVEYRIRSGKHSTAASQPCHIRLAWVHVLGIGAVVVSTHLRVHPNDLGTLLYEHVDQE
jgi:hypothetical protein